MNRIPLVCLIPLFVLAAAACGSSPAPAPAPVAAQAAADYYTGHWRGLADLTSPIPDAPSQMDISVTIVNDGQCGSFEYGALACSGVWTCNSRFDASAMSITETVRYGAERCATGARVELRATDDPNQLQIIYQGAGVTATGTLQRNDVQY